MARRAGQGLGQGARTASAALEPRRAAIASSLVWGAVRVGAGVSITAPIPEEGRLGLPEPHIRKPHYDTASWFCSFIQKECRWLQMMSSLGLRPAAEDGKQLR